MANELSLVAMAVRYFYEIMGIIKTSIDNDDREV
jgi:hypothetical protein